MSKASAELTELNSPAAESTPVCQGKRKRIALLITFGFLLAGIALRANGKLQRSLEYDEIWTLEHYVKADSIRTILTDMSLPNNHVFSSLCIRLSVALFGDDFMWVRLPSLLSGIGILLCTWYLATCLFRDSPLYAALATGFCSFHAGLIHYSQTARGYALQIFIILAFVCAIIHFERGLLNRKVGFLLFAALPFLAHLTLPTSVLYITPICAFHLYYRLRNENFSTNSFLQNSKGVIMAYACGAIASISWLGAHWEQILAGSKLAGSNNGGRMTFWGWTWRTFDHVGPWPLLLLSLLPLLTRRNRFWTVLYALFVISPFAVAASTVGGAARVYLSLTPFVCIAAAAGTRLLLKRFFRANSPVAYAIVFLFIGLNALALPQRLRAEYPRNWPAIHREIERRVSKHDIVVYPTEGGYPIWYHNRPIEAHIVKNNGFRLYNFSGKDIPVTRLQGSASAVVRLPGKGQNTLTNVRPGLSATAFGFKRIEPSVTPELPAYAAAIGPVSKADLQKAAGIFQHPMNMNQWFSVTGWFEIFERGNGTEYAPVLLAVSPSLSKEQMLKLEAISEGKVRFYHLVKPSEDTRKSDPDAETSQ